MTVTQASLDALAAHTRKRRDTVSRIASKKHCGTCADRTPQSPSAAFHAAPGSPAKASTDATTWWHSFAPIARSLPSPTTQRRRQITETTIVPALRARLTAKDAQIADLQVPLHERDRTIS